MKTNLQQPEYSLPKTEPAIAVSGGYVPLVHGSFFSGAGGFDLAAEWMDWENAFHCEWNPFLQRILKFYWPNAASYGDITKTDFTFWRGRIDILTGGFPCQPYSVAGKQKGTEDERHLWPQMRRAIREVKPAWVVGENVRGLVDWNAGMVFDEVQADLEVEGYEVLPFLLPAAGVNAPHRRDRIWFVAYSGRDGYGCDNEFRKTRCQASTSISVEEKRERFRGYFGRTESAPNAPVTVCKSGKKIQTKKGKSELRSEYIGHGQAWRTWWGSWPTQSPVYNGDDGLSTKLDGITISELRQKSIEAGGNAIAPQVAYQIFNAIESFRRLSSGT